MSAMEYIGDDLIERAVADMEAVAVRGTAIWTKGIAAAACLSLIVSGAYYVGMWYNHNNQGLVSDPEGDDPVITTKGKPMITTESKPQITTGSMPVITSESKPAVVTESEPVITSESKPVTTESKPAVTEESKPPVTTSKESDVVPEPTHEKPYINRTRMEEVYRYDENRTSFSKMRIDKVKGVYRDHSSELEILNGGANYYIFVECTVVEDYYDTVESGTSIVLRLPFPMTSDFTGFADPYAVMDFLAGYDTIFAYFEPRKYTSTFYSAKTDQQYVVDSTYDVSLSQYHILPVSDGKLDTNSLVKFMNEAGAWLSSDNYSNQFWRGIQDGTDEMEFSKTIRKLKENQINGMGSYNHEERVACEMDKCHFIPGETMTAVFTVYSLEIAESFTYDATDCKVLSATIDETGKHILIELACEPNSDKCHLSLCVTLTSGDDFYRSVYAITNEYGTFTSPFSNDDAYESFFEYAKENGIMTDREIEEARQELWRRCVESTPPPKEEPKD